MSLALARAGGWVVAAAAVAISAAAPANAETGTSNGKTYAVTTTLIDGATPDQLGNWDAKVGELSGGDPAVVEAFNHASRTAAEEQVERAKSEGGQGEKWIFESNGQVSFRTIAVAELILGTSYYGLHPTSYISTVVIDSRTAAPIALTDLFADGQAGLNRLSELTGAEPRTENFANWIPTAEGLEIHFAPYQFGIALPETKTVSWAALADLIAPGMAEISQA